MSDDFTKIDDNELEDIAGGGRGSHREPNPKYHVGERVRINNVLQGLITEVIKHTVPHMKSSTTYSYKVLLDDTRNTIEVAQDEIRCKI